MGQCQTLYVLLSKHNQYFFLGIVLFPNCLLSLRLWKVFCIQLCIAILYCHLTKYYASHWSFMIKAITYNFLSSVDHFEFKGRRRNVLTVTVGECTVKWLHVNTLADECLPRADVRSAESQWRVCDLCCYLLSLSTLVLPHSLSHTVYCISVCLAGVKQPDAITRSAPLKNKLYNGEFITVFTIIILKYYERITFCELSRFM